MHARLARLVLITIAVLLSTAAVAVASDQLYVALREHVELDNTILRSDHASNYLVLKGTLGKDKQRLVNMVRTALDTPDAVPLRQEWQRGL